MVLEYVEGRTLRAAITGNTRDTAAMAIELMLPVARALVCAHGMGMVHCDLNHVHMRCVAAQESFTRFNSRASG